MSPPSGPVFFGGLFHLFLFNFILFRRFPVPGSPLFQQWATTWGRINENASQRFFVSILLIVANDLSFAPLFCLFTSPR